MENLNLHEEEPEADASVHEVHFKISIDMSDGNPQVLSVEHTIEAKQGLTYKEKVLAILESELKNCENERQAYDSIIPEIMNNSAEYRDKKLESGAKYWQVRRIYELSKLL